ncbi:hypothetical protein ACNQFN_22100 [Thauera butanivorans]
MCAEAHDTSLNREEPGQKAATLLDQSLDEGHPFNQGSVTKDFPCR